MAQRISGIVDRVFFTSAKFSAGALKTEVGDRIRFRGPFCVSEGDVVSIEGKWKDDPKYGQQFVGESLSYDLPDTPEGLVQYLAKHPAFTGIGETTARKIVDYATSTEHLDRMIRKDILELHRALRIPRKTLESLREAWIAHSSDNEVRSYLAGFGLTHHQMETLLETFGNSVVGLLRADPYQLIRYIKGYGFKRVDKIARAMGTPNNSYARGISLTLANDIVGTGPRLQMLTDDPSANRIIEIEFSRWSNAVGLAEKLRTMKLASCGDGEAFGILTSNSNIQTAVQLDLMLVEADQVTTPFGIVGLTNYIDGIQFDVLGNPVLYHVLKSHPGDTGTAWGEFGTVPAAAMLHLFRVDRPGQVRGIPEITPALPLFAQLRRFTLAVIAAAETVAEFAGILYTDSPANGEADAAEPFESIELEKRTLVTMPGGWKMSQIQAEQPCSTYSEFKHEILNEIARCLNMPYNVAAGNSSGYNYASGRLDHQTYFKSIRVEQSNMARVVLDRILAAWLSEASLIEDFLPQSVRTTTFAGEHQWFWDGQEHVDPLKEANAQGVRLSNHTTTLAYEYARQGRDWEDALYQRAKELALMSELGLALPGAPVSALPPDVNEESLSDPAAND